MKSCRWSYLLWMVQIVALDKGVHSFLMERLPPDLRISQRRPLDRPTFCESPRHRSLMQVARTDRDNGDEKCTESSPLIMDEYAHLVESNPHDDPEPRPPAYSESTSSPSLKAPRGRRRLNPNPYKIPTDPHQEWEWFYAKLKAQNETHQLYGDVSSVYHDIIEESLMRHWMANQRKSFMKTLGVLDISEQANWGADYLPAERKRRLDAVGFYWGHLQPSSLTNDFIYSQDFQRQVRLKYKDWIWNPIYEKLARYYRLYGHTNVPLTNDDTLGVWTAKQRNIRWEMPERRRRRLDEIHFDWEWKDPSFLSPSNATHAIDNPTLEAAVPFARRLSQLKEYRKIHGDCDVPLDYELAPGLGDWVNRTRFRRQTLSPNICRQLEKIGLEFATDEENTGE